MSLKEITKILNGRKEELFQKGVKELSLFGSLVRGDDTKNSDVDILIEFDSKKGLFEFVKLKNYLEGVLGREVDLVTKSALHPALKKKILNEAKHVF